MSILSSSVSSKVQGVRRHLRAVRRAGARRDGEPCNDGPLLMEMSKVFKLNILLGFLGMQLVKIEKPHQTAAAPSPQKEEVVSDSEEEDDPDYVPEHRDSDDSLEYRYVLIAPCSRYELYDAGLIRRLHRNPRTMTFSLLLS